MSQVNTQSDTQKFRLVTRSDMDGLVCAVLLKELDLIDEITFAHPKDMQDGIIEITERDIITNLPYAEKAHLVFDHHLSETIRNDGDAENHIIDAVRYAIYSILSRPNFGKYAVH